MIHSSTSVRSLFAAGLVLLGASCATVTMPDHRISLNYMAASMEGETNVGALRKPDTDMFAGTLDWEGVAITENINLTGGVMFRRNQIENLPGDPLIDANIVRAGVRWHYPVMDLVTVFAGPHVGVATSIDANDVRAQFDTSLYADVEAGVRWSFFGDVGVQALANYSYLDLQGKRPQDPNGDLRGLTFGGGLYVDF
ncbi:MAG TPA: hypothetical protein VGC54_09180 [Planctomycetota bacterium]